MPASLTRTCPRCENDRLIAEFRDEADVSTGRPPKVCRYCRAEDPALQARQIQNRTRRPVARATWADRRARSDREIAATRNDLRPDGIKWCPEISGCGQYLPLSEFTPDRSQLDGLASMCASCAADYARLHADA